MVSRSEDDKILSFFKIDVYIYNKSSEIFAQNGKLLLTF